MKFEAIDVVRTRGTATEITSEEIITGTLDFVPHPDGTASLMLPVEQLVETNEDARNRGILEAKPLGRMDMRNREIVHLGKREVVQVISTGIGEEIDFIRKGWGKTWHQRVQRVS